MQEIRIGIIGVGQIGKMHLDEYVEMEGVTLVAAADIDGSELERVAGQYGIERTHSDFRELLACDDIDAVDVCLHNNLHMSVTAAALEAGKHVFCEKPMAGAYVDAVKMLDTARARGRMLSIQLGSLFEKETKVAKRLIEAGHLGKVYHARSTGFRRRGRPYVDGYGTESFVQKEVAAGGALFDMGVYHIARMLHLLGMPAVERISGKVYQETDMDAARRKTSGYDVEELGLGFVKLADNITLDVIESWAIHLDRFEGSYVVGPAGGIRLEPFSFHATMSDVEMDATFDLAGADWRWRQLDEVQTAYDSPQSHWVAALRGQVDLLPTAEIALATMLISEGIYLSDKLGREVAADEVLENSRSAAVTI